jgi:hypothetical protein
MKRILLILFIVPVYVFGQNVGIGTFSPDPSALLELNTDSGSVSFPKLSTLDRDLIASPSEGLIIFNTDISCIEVFNGATWDKSCPCKSIAGSVQSNKLIFDNCNTDELIYLNLTEFKSKIKWQYSLNNIKYFNLTNNQSATDDYIGFGSYCPSYIRARVNDEGCEYVLSDTIFIDITSQNSWTKRANFPISWTFHDGSSGRTNYTFPNGGPAYFVIDSFGYIMGGYHNPNGSPSNNKVVWRYDYKSDSWTQVAGSTNSGLVRMNPMCFSLLGKGYVGAGMRYYGDQRSMYMYDPITNIWVGRAPFPDYPRDRFVQFTIGDRYYVGGGGFSDPGKYPYNYDTGKTPTTIKKDFWEYNPYIDAWIRIKDFPFLLWNGAGFSAHGKGYVVANPHSLTGHAKSLDPTVSITLVSPPQLWEFDPKTGNWTQKTAPPNFTSGSGMNLFYGRLFSFSMCGYGYVYPGKDGLMWQYDPIDDSWEGKPPPPSGIPEQYLRGPIACPLPINGNLYLMHNKTGAGVPWETWRYCP